MKNKHNGGFTLVELLVSIVILAAIVLPTCTSLVLSYRMNAKSEALMQAQLAVSSAVETLMAEGISETKAETAVKTENGGVYDFVLADGSIGQTDHYPNVTIKIETVPNATGYYSVTVTDDDALVEVVTQIRVATGGAGA